MKKFNRGDRVGLTGYYLQECGDVQGTVTHLPGDDGFKPLDEDEDVWVEWDKETPLLGKDSWLDATDLVPVA